MGNIIGLNVWKHWKKVRKTNFCTVIRLATMVCTLCATNYWFSANTQLVYYIETLQNVMYAKQKENEENWRSFAWQLYMVCTCSYMVCTKLSWCENSITTESIFSCFIYSYHVGNVKGKQENQPSYMWLCQLWNGTSRKCVYMYIVECTCAWLAPWACMTQWRAGCKYLYSRT